jgi:hypothetical protein
MTPASDATAASADIGAGTTEKTTVTERLAERLPADDYPRLAGVLARLYPDRAAQDRVLDSIGYTWKYADLDQLPAEAFWQAMLIRLRWDSASGFTIKIIDEGLRRNPADPVLQEIGRRARELRAKADAADRARDARGDAADQALVARADAADQARAQSAGPAAAPFVIVSMTFQSETLDMRQFSFLVTAIDELCATLGTAMAVRLNVDPRGEPLPPRILSVRMSSPLTIELGAIAGGGGVSFAALRVLAAVVRDPGLLGGFIPRVKTGWYDARTAQYEAQMRLEAVRRLAGDVTVSLITSEPPEFEESELRSLAVPSPPAPVSETSTYL